MYCLNSQMISIISKSGMLVQWVSIPPHRMLMSVCTFTCSLCMCMGSIQGLWFLPTSKIMAGGELAALN